MADLQTSTANSSVDTPSSSTSTNCPNYYDDVFISHRGLDVKNSFAGPDMASSDGSGWNSLVSFLNLQDKCLVELDGNTIRMHDHLRDMGREIADQEKPGGHLWRPTNDINDLWQQSSVISEVRGIRTVPSLIDYDEILESEERLSCFKSLCDKVLGNWRKLIDTTPYRLRELQLVATEDGHLKSILKRVESPDLIWVRWNNCPSTCLPSWISMKNIRVLQVVGKQLKSLWRAESQAPLELRELNIYAPLSEFPKSIGQLKHIEKIVVERSNLQSLQKNFFHLPSLKHLLLSRSHSIESLPDSFGCLTSLQELDLSCFWSLQALPDFVGCLTSLQELDLSYCGSLQAFPDSVGGLDIIHNSLICLWALRVQLLVVGKQPET